MDISKKLWLMLNDEGVGWMTWRLSVFLSQVETGFEEVQDFALPG